MSSSFDQLQPASQHQTAVYLPYIQGNKRNLLPYAISLYQKGVLEGQRKIEASLVLRCRLELIERRTHRF